MGAGLSSIDQGDYDQGPEALQLNSNYTLIPLILGWCFNLILTGVVMSWAARYMSRSEGDKKGIKVAVAFTVVFELATAILNLISITLHAVSQNRTNDEISRIFTSDALGTSLGAVVAVAVQQFFATRCYQLLPRRYRVLFVIYIGTLIVSGFAGAFGTTIVELINHGATDVTRGASPGAYGQLYILAMVWLWSNFACDVTISSLLMYTLWKKRPKLDLPSLSEHADTLLHGLVRLSFETAVLTSLAATTAAILYVTTTATTNLSYAFANILPGLYALSLLWALNAAHRLRSEIEPAAYDSAIQLVWNLAGDEKRPVSNAERTARMADIAMGNGASVQIRQSLAPSKAVRKLGHEVKLLTIGHSVNANVVLPIPAVATSPTLGNEWSDEEKEAAMNESYQSGRITERRASSNL